MTGQGGVGHQGSDPEPALLRILDAVQPEVLNIDQMVRRLDLQLHQIEQIGPAGDEFGARTRRHRRRGFGGRAGAFVGEGPHARTPATSAIASAMLE